MDMATSINLLGYVSASGEKGPSERPRGMDSCHNVLSTVISCIHKCMHKSSLIGHACGGDDSEPSVTASRRGSERDRQWAAKLKLAGPGTPGGGQWREKAGTCIANRTCGPWGLQNGGSVLRSAQRHCNHYLVSFQTVPQLWSSRPKLGPLQPGGDAQGHDQRTGQQERTEEAQCVDVGGGTTRAARPVTRRDQGSVAGLCGRDKCEGGMHVWHACLHFSYRHASCIGAWRKNAAALHSAKSSSGRSPDNTMTQIRVDMQAARDWSTQAPAQV